MATLYSYDLVNQKRDLTDVLSTCIAQSPQFIGLFKNSATATNRKHEWLEDVIMGRSVTASVSSSVITLSSVTGLEVGTLVSIANDSALFKIATLTGSVATFTLVAANGSTSTAASITDGKVLDIVGTPTIEGSYEAAKSNHQTDKSFNYSQIFRKEIMLTGTAIATNVYGNIDNSINFQTEYIMQELTRDLNRVVLKGSPIEGTSSVAGQAGGLYYFGTQSGGLAVAGGSNTADSYLINDGAQAILAAGGVPNLILCSPGQARVLSSEYKGKLQIMRSDETRGAYVAVVVNEITGGAMTIVADYDVPDTDIWVMDSSGFGLSSLQGRSIADSDTTPSGFDGIRRTLMGELTFEFKNAKQRLCRISGVKASATALAALRS